MGEQEGIYLGKESMLTHCRIWNEENVDQQEQTFPVGGRPREGWAVIILQKYGAWKDLYGHVA